MLSKEDFIKVIRNIQRYERFLERLKKLHINTIEIDDLWINGEVCDIFFSNIFGTKGVDRINYWLYEENNYLDSPDIDIENLYDEVCKL